MVWFAKCEGGTGWMHTDASASDREQNFAKRLLLEARTVIDCTRASRGPQLAVALPCTLPGGLRGTQRTPNSGERGSDARKIGYRRGAGSSSTATGFAQDGQGSRRRGARDGRVGGRARAVQRRGGREGGRGATDHGGMRIGWVAAGVRACGWTRCEGRRVRTRAASRLLALNAIRGIHYGETGATSSAAGGNEWGREKGLGRAQGRICYRARISVLARGG